MSEILQVSKTEFFSAASDCTCLSSASLGAEVVNYSDQWFAEATNLINPNPPVCEVRFVPSGRWYDGWETRRHNTEPSDWVVFKLGVKSAKILGVEVDTAYFNGNHAPAISVEASHDGLKWSEVIEKTDCGASQQHFFLRQKGLTSETFSFVRLHMYPDGGIARFRVYGEPVPVFPTDTSEELDMALVSNGGTTIAVSDQHFSSADNILLPGRGTDMSDGWETSRSRVPGHVDWVVVKLGAPTKINRVIVDTAFFRGNFPQFIKIEGLSAPDNASAKLADANWTEVVPKSKTHADQEHIFAVEQHFPAVTHVKLTIIPDGGVKRLRVFGTRA